MLILLVGTGILLTFLAKWFQVSHIGNWMKNNVGGVTELDDVQYSDSFHSK